MTQETKKERKICGFQPTGKAEDIPKPPKFLSKRELELQEVKYIFSLRAERDELQEQLNTAKKSLAESEKMYQKQMDRFLNSEMNESARSHCESQLKLLKPAHKAYEALAAIGGEDE